MTKKTTSLSSPEKSTIYPVPKGSLAAVVTYLRQAAPKQKTRPSALPWPVGTRLSEIEKADQERFLTAVKRVGEPHLWWEFRNLTQAEREALFDAPEWRFFLLCRAGQDIGLLILSFEGSGAKRRASIVLFGLAPESVGQGLGKKLMKFALQEAWQENCREVIINTCTLDHPRALAFYLAMGFVPVRREVDIFPDPRLTGLSPPGSMPAFPPI